MTPSIRIVSWIRASEDHRRRGLLGYLVLELDELFRFEAVTLRRTRRGTLLLSFPERIDAHGVRHAIVCPKNREARRRIEKLVFEQLNLAPEAAEDDLC